MCLNVVVRCWVLGIGGQVSFGQNDCDVVVIGAARRLERNGDEPAQAPGRILAEIPLSREQRGELLIDKLNTSHPQTFRSVQRLRCRCAVSDHDRLRRVTGDKVGHHGTDLRGHYNILVKDLERFRIGRRRRCAAGRSRAGCWSDDRDAALGATWVYGHDDVGCFAH